MCTQHSVSFDVFVIHYKPWAFPNGLHGAQLHLNAFSMKRCKYSFYAYEMCNTFSSNTMVV